MFSKVLFLALSVLGESVTSYTSPSATPVPTAGTSGTEVDIGVLQYALILEHLEAAFYKEGMQKYTSKDFTDAGFDDKTFKNFQDITSHEQTHVTALNATISAAGYEGVPPCEYNFPYTDVKTFVALAKVLENTGVKAYAGAIHLITSNDYKRVGASIEAVEARHSSYINLISGTSPFPDAFDSTLNQRAVVGIAATLIKKCPFTLPINPYSTLMITPSSGSVGTVLQLNSTELKENDTEKHVYCSFLFSLSQSWSHVSNKTCEVPKDVTGDAYVFLTSDNSSKIALDSQSSVLSGPAVFTFVAPKLGEVTSKAYTFSFTLVPVLFLAMML